MTKARDVNGAGSEINTVNVASLTRKHIIIIHTGNKLHSIRTHHVMNITHRFKISVPIIMYSFTSYASFSFTFNENTLQRMYFNTDLPWILPGRKGTLRCRHSHEPGCFIIYCSRVGYSWIDCRKLRQTLKLWALLICSKKKALNSFKDMYDCEFTDSFTKKYKGYRKNFQW